MNRILLTLMVACATIVLAGEWTQATTTTTSLTAPSFETSGLIKYLHSRPHIVTGYGPVIDDLEQMADKASHGMTNKSDLGNWAHELTHYVNSMFRRAATRQFQQPGNGCYIVGGYALTLPEPALTLADIARRVPKEHRNGTYDTYLVRQQRWWNKEPLYVLDEATAAMNGLQYQVDARKTDKHREKLLRDWMVLVKILVITVRERDPGYSHLPQLEAFVDWYVARGKLMADRHNHQAR